jgi:hypothetical protein
MQQEIEKIQGVKAVSETLWREWNGYLKTHVIDWAQI